MSAGKDNDWEHYQDIFDTAKEDLELNEVVPLVGVRIALFMDADGNHRYTIKHIGEMSLTTTVGLIEMSKVDLMEWYRNG